MVKIHEQKEAISIYIKTILKTFKMKNLNKLLIIVGVVILLIVLIKGVLPKPPVPERAYTQSELSLKLNLQADSLQTSYLENRLKSNDSVRIELGSVITNLQESQKKLRVTSSKQETIIKELKGKLVNDNSIETCKVLVDAQGIQLYNKQTEIDSLNKEADYWALLQDSTELALIDAKTIISLKSNTIKDISENLIKQQENLANEKEKNGKLETNLKKKKGDFWKGLGTGIAATIATYIYIKR